VSLKYKFFGHFRTVKNDHKQWVNEAELKIDTRYDFADKYSIVMNPIIRWDNRFFTAEIINTLQEGTENKASERRYYLNAQEAYIVRHGESSDFYIGKKVYSWGKAEGFNPTDNINPYGFLDFLDSEKIGVFSAALEYSLGDYTIDLVAIPLFTPSRLPSEGNRWAGDADEEDTTAGNIQQKKDKPGVVIHERELPPNTIESSQVAARLRTSLSGWDFSLSYYHGFDSIPAVEKETRGGEDHYTPVFNKINVVGLATATTFDQLEVHSEIAYRDTEQGDDDSFISLVLGGSYNWNLEDAAPEFIEKISLYFEWAEEKITDKKDNEKRSSSSFYTRGFRNSLLGSLIVKFNEDTELQVSGNYNLSEFDSFVQPKLTYNFTDDIKFVAGFDFITGHKDTFWGKWRKNDRFFSNVTWYF
jgi:hypothetical protein